MRWRVLLLIAVLWAMGGLHAAVINDPALRTLLRQAPGTDEYPSDDAIWLRRDITITVESSGAFTVEEHQLLKILTERGIALAQWEIPYDKATESLEVRTARTLLNDQTFPVVPTQVVENATYQGVAWYDSVMVRRFPLPAATVGATLEVATTCRHRVPRVPQAFSTRLFLQQHYPIRDARYTIRVPLAQRLAIHFAGKETPSVQEHEQGEYREYSWSLHSVPACKLDELQTPPSDDLIPSVRITSLTSWAPVAKWYADITQGKDAVTDALRTLARERTAGCTSSAEKITALHKAVRDIPYVAVEMGATSDVPHDAEAVARQNYGDCKDKTTLLRALLNAVGITSDYVLVRTTDRGTLDAHLYGADEFNHVILVAHTPDGEQYLDPTLSDVPATLLPPGVDGAEGLVIHGDGTLVRLPASSAAQNATDIRVTITVHTDFSAQGTVTLTFSGQNAIVQRGILADIAKDKYREALQGYLGARLGPGILITDVDIQGLREPERPMVIVAQFSSSQYLQQAGEQWSANLPLLAVQPNYFQINTTRRYPLAQPLASSMRLSASITLPEGLIVTHLPSAVHYSSAIGEYQDDTHAYGTAINYICSLTANRGNFPPEAYPDICRWSSILAAEGRNQLQYFVKQRQ